MPGPGDESNGQIKQQKNSKPALCSKSTIVYELPVTESTGHGDVTPGIGNMVYKGTMTLHGGGQAPDLITLQMSSPLPHTCTCQHVARQPRFTKLKDKASSSRRSIQGLGFTPGHRGQGVGHQQTLHAAAPMSEEGVGAAWQGLSEPSPWGQAICPGETARPVLRVSRTQWDSAEPRSTLSQSTAQGGGESSCLDKLRLFSFRTSPKELLSIVGLCRSQETGLP